MTARYPTMTPESSRLRTRRRQGDGVSPTRSASSMFGSRPSTCSSPKIARSNSSTAEDANSSPPAGVIRHRMPFLLRYLCAAITPIEGGANDQGNPPGRPRGRGSGSSARLLDQDDGLRLAQDAPYGDERWLEVRTPDKSVTVVLSLRQGERPTAPEMLPTSNTSFYCDDLPKTYEELRSRGVEFPQPPVEQPFGWWSMFEDLEGNRFALTPRE